MIFMNRSLVPLIALFIVFAAFISCNNQTTKKESDVKHITAADEKAMASSPPVIIYKTKANYDTLVPVILSTEKDHIVSFPDVRDLVYKGELSYPTRLADSFLLDNRGITEKVAFLDISYSKYRSLDKTPQSSELYEMILDNDPVEVMYFCGSRAMYKDIVKELNEKIKAGDFSLWSKLK